MPPAGPPTRCWRRSRERLGNDPDTELRVAAEQQRQITALRLDKLLREPRPTSTLTHPPTDRSDTVSLSTHVLDTATGVPAPGSRCPSNVRTATAGTDLVDGRPTPTAASAASSPGGALTAGVHRLTFDVAGDCGRVAGGTTFFPEVTSTFAVTAPDEHHHVPLLLSPFGYSTYRGS